jgi:hypothetical protein
MLKRRVRIDVTRRSRVTSAAREGEAADPLVVRDRHGALVPPPFLPHEPEQLPGPDEPVSARQGAHGRRPSQDERETDD